MQAPDQIDRGYSEGCICSRPGGSSGMYISTTFNISSVTSIPESFCVPAALRRRAELLAPVRAAAEESDCATEGWPRRGQTPTTISRPRCTPEYMKQSRCSWPLPSTCGQYFIWPKKRHSLVIMCPAFLPPLPSLGPPGDRAAQHALWV